MRVLVSVLFWLVFLVTAPLGALAGALLFVLTRPFDRERLVVHAFICRWTHAYLKLNPWWDIQVRHRDRLPKGPAVLIANHQSMADVPVAMGLYHPFKFVSKKSLFSLPIVGWMMRLAGYVEIDRGKPRSTQKMLENCRDWLRRGVPVLIFPEGTYGPPGQLLPFKRGAFLLAIEEKVPLVPIIIEGTTGLVVDDGPWLNARCRIRVEVQPPIGADALGADATQLAARMRELYERALSRGPAAEVVSLSPNP